MKPRKNRTDAVSTVILARDLEHIQSKVYEKKFPQLKGRMLVPSETDVDPGANNYTTREYAPLGMAQMIAAYADDFPRADVVATESTTSIHGIGMAYGYDFQEQRAAQFAGRPLEQAKGNACRRAMEMKLDSIILNGESTRGLKGLFNLASANTVTVAADGVGGSQSFTTKTPDQQLRDLHAIANYAPEQTNGVETQDEMLVPLTLYHTISTTRMSDGSDVTILKMFLDTSPYIKKVTPMPQLQTAGGSSSRRIVCYRNDPDVVKHILPQDFEQLPPFNKGKSVVIDCHMRTGGVVSQFPMGVSYADNV